MSAALTHPQQLRELLGIPFTPEQLACATAPLAPQVIVAGAGSGKTTVMAARVVWLVGTGQVAAERVLGLTFTNKAAGELAQRVRGALSEAGVLGAPGAGPPPGAPPSATSPRPGVRNGAAAGAAVDDEPAGEPQISTYHAFAGRLLSEHGLRIGVEPGARLLADATRFQLAATVLRSATGPFTWLTSSLPTLVEDLLALDGELSEHLVEPDRLRAHDHALLTELERARLTNERMRRLPDTVRARGELLTLVEEYRRRKRERDLLDFGDQIALAATLARDLPEVGRTLREQFGVVLLDEYQDTSVAQRVMLAGLFGAGTGHPVTAVGDPCQAIYGWRGASVANLDDFPDHFPDARGRPARRQALSENRRSGGRLLQLANRLAEPLRERHSGVEALRPAPGAEWEGRVRCALLPTHAEEVAWLADSLAHLVRTGTPPAQIAVLCRGAGDFAEIQSALVAREVPVEVVGLSGLLHLPEVADLVATCEVLQDPTANAALVRLLTGPRWRIGPRDLALLGRLARDLARGEVGAAHFVPGGTAAGDRPGEGAAGPVNPDGPEDGGGRDGGGGSEYEGGPEDAAGPEGGSGARLGEERLAAAVEGVDPAEVISLADALDSFLAPEPADGGMPFSAPARVRFARFAAELRELRRALADPLMDVLHRVLAVTGLEVELSASPQALAARRRETLNAFLDVAAGFAALDGEATLPAFLGFLRAAAQHEKGLDGSLPGGENAVKVLTAHKSKGLEWDVVAVPGLVDRQFPSTRPRESWLTRPRVLPHALRGDAATLPDLTSWDPASRQSYEEAMREHQRVEELRLGYVTFTRPRSLLLGSGHWWGPTQKKVRGPSDFLVELRAHCEADPAHGEVEAWADCPEEGEENPSRALAAQERLWPLPLDPVALERRRRAAARVRARLAGDVPGEVPDPPDGHPVPGPLTGLDEPTAPGQPAGPDGRPEQDVTAVPWSRESGPPGEDDQLSPEDSRTVASWDRDLDALAEELRRSRATVREVPLPASLSATDLTRLAADPEGFARELARPMPRPPHHAAARRGTRFHAWVESRFEELVLPVFGPEELPGADAEDEPDAAEDQDAFGTDPEREARELGTLKAAFCRTPYAYRVPYRVEAPFQLLLAGRTIRGRIDAVYRETGDRGETYEIIDWKTSRTQNADPLQLAIYRLAWAEQCGLPLSAVSAAFLYVRTGELVRPSPLPDRAALERLLLHGPSGGDGEHQDPKAPQESDDPADPADPADPWVPREPRGPGGPGPGAGAADRR